MSKESIISDINDKIKSASGANSITPNIVGDILLDTVELIPESGGSEITGPAYSIPRFNIDGNGLEQSSIQDSSNVLNINKATEIDGIELNSSGLKFTRLNNSPLSSITYPSTEAVNPVDFLIDGNFAYILNSNSSGIRRVNLTTQVSELFSETSSQPYAIKKDSLGDFIVVTRFGNVDKITSDGNYSILCSIPSSDFRKVVIDSQDNIYVSNISGVSAGHHIYKVDLEGNYSIFVNGEMGFSEFVMDSQDNLYGFKLAQSDKNLYKITTGGISSVSVLAVISDPDNFAGVLRVDKEDNLILRIGNKIIKVLPNGSIDEYVITQLSNNISSIGSYAVDLDTNDIWLNSENGIIFTLSNTGVITQSTLVIPAYLRISTFKDGIFYFVNSNLLIKVNKNFTKVLTLDSEGNVILHDKDLSKVNSFDEVLTEGNLTNKSFLYKEGTSSTTELGVFGSVLTDDGNGGLNSDGSAFIGIKTTFGSSNWRGIGFADRGEGGLSLVYLKQDGIDYSERIFNFPFQDPNGDDTYGGVVITNKSLCEYNSTTTELTLTYLTDNYWRAEIGFRLHCDNVTPNAVIYEKTSYGWLKINATKLI